MVTLRIGFRPFIFISDRSIAHHALIQNGSVFSNCPTAVLTSKLLNSNQHNITSAAYGHIWRLLRHNLTSDILHPSRVKFYASASKWVLEILIRRLELQSKSGDFVRLDDHFRYAKFCLLVFMCFGDKVDEDQTKQIENVHRNLLGSVRRFNILNFWPSIGKFVFKKRWEESFQLWKDQEDVLIPLIRSRKQLMTEKLNESKRKGASQSDDLFVLSYVDILLDLHLPNENRKIDEGEMVTLCSEFLNAGTDTTSTALQWIMGNIVKYPHIQNKLVEEINGVFGPEEVEVKEDDLPKMPYLKAVILEGLRRHPPTHLLLPHSVTKDVNIQWSPRTQKCNS